MASARRRRTDPPGVAARPWALVGWLGYLRYDFREYEAVCSAWALAEDTVSVDGVDYSQVARVRLGVEPSEWPRLWLASDLHYAPLTRATPALPPDGTQWDTTPTYRRRTPHYELASGRSRRWPPLNRNP